MPYVPDIIPPEDRDVIQDRLHGGEEKRVGFGESPALIIVDMNNSCVTDDFPSGRSDIGVPCARNIRKLASVCRAQAIPVIYTTVISFLYADHAAVRGHWKEKMASIPKEKVEQGKAIFDELAPQNGDILIEKDKASAFFGTQLSSILTYLRVDTVIVTGVSTSGCVRATVCDAFQLNYRVIIPEECVCDRSQISHKVNLFDMDIRYGDVVKTAEVLKYLENLTKKKLAKIVVKNSQS